MFQWGKEGNISNVDYYVFSDGEEKINSQRSFCNYDSYGNWRESISLLKNQVFYRVIEYSSMPDESIVSDETSLQED